MINSSHYIRDRNRLLLIYFLFYYVILLGFAMDGRLLSQYQPIFFNYNHDLTEIALIASGLPRLMISHPASFVAADILVFLLPLPIIWREGRRRPHSPSSPPSPWAGLIFLIGFALYLLLADIFWQVHFEPFVLIILVGAVWTTRKAGRFYLLLKGCRYYFLYLFVSAAAWKLARGAVFNGEEMSRILLLHHTDLLAGGCTSFLCRTYGWLIVHSALSQSLYIAAALLEAAFLVGFFTRRFDRWLMALAVLFVIADLVLMRIPYWTVLIGLVPLWYRDGDWRSSGEGPRIALYETTHHENLPALLDLCESRFNQVAVFLKESSYHNLVGHGTPEQRWPQTEFYVQTSGCSNRRFIRQLFVHVRRHGFTHLHFCTLDNNLLIVALRVVFIGPVHLSLTLHEVNEYFSRSLRDFRDTSETMAKLILHRLVRHYHVFLPGMASQLKGRLPGSTAVFIPSRFYSGHRPIARAGPFRIVLPGSVDPNRRNYDLVFQAMYHLKALPDIPQFEIVLAGDSSQRRAAHIVKGFQSFASDRMTIRTFHGYVPQVAYEEEFARAQLIWSPLNVAKIGSRGNAETYGVTTASGLTADLLLGNIPALVPAGFVAPGQFQKAILPYRNAEEAAEIILHLASDAAAYDSLRVDIHRAFNWFSKENFVSAFTELTGGEP